MKNHATAGCVARSLMGPAVFLGCGVLAAVWLGRVEGRHYGLPALVLVFTAVVGMIWQARILAAWRLQAALDAYAQREIALHDRRRHARQKTRSRDRTIALFKEENSHARAQSQAW